MPDHDQLFKQLLQEFFGDLLHIVAPTLAEKLRTEDPHPVVPIVPYLRGGKPDVTRETVQIEVHGEVFMSFSYLAFGLSRSTATDYLGRPEPLAWALAGLMRPGDLSPAQRRLACLRQALKADLDDALKYLLINCIETYVQLDPPDQEEYDALLAGEENREVAVMEMTWADRIAHEAREGALKEGVEQGREEGRRELLRELLERRFGPLPKRTLQRLQALTSPDDLSRLAARVLDARSLDELGL